MSVTHFKALTRVEQPWSSQHSNKIYQFLLQGIYSKYNEIPTTVEEQKSVNTKFENRKDNERRWQLLINDMKNEKAQLPQHALQWRYVLKPLYAGKNTSPELQPYVWEKVKIPFSMSLFRDKWAIDLQKQLLLFTPLCQDITRIITNYIIFYGKIHLQSVNVFCESDIQKITDYIIERDQTLSFSQFLIKQQGFMAFSKITLKFTLPFEHPYLVELQKYPVTLQQRRAILEPNLNFCHLKYISHQSNHLYKIEHGCVYFKESVSYVSE